MPTRKIADAWKPSPPCPHPEHEPPSMVLLQPGTYEHECPVCHAKYVFTVHTKRLS